MRNDKKKKKSTDHFLKFLGGEGECHVRYIFFWFSGNLCQAVLFFFYLTLACGCLHLCIYSVMWYRKEKDGEESLAFPFQSVIFYHEGTRH